MPTPVLICDDSGLARKQLASSLPAHWDVSVNFAAGGAEALAAVEAGQGEILFLDLNMPQMDGFEVLEAIRARDLPTMVIVVSGDIQPEARERVLKLGALDFLKKPVDAARVAETLARFGLYTAGAGSAGETRAVDLTVESDDAYREIANIALGRAADLLARLLGVFVKMPVPRVLRLDGAALRARVGDLTAGDGVWSIGQGFVGTGLSGEALLVFRNPDFADIAALLKHPGAPDEPARIELLTDIANILIGASLQGIADQLDLKFNQGHPAVLGRGARIGPPPRQNGVHWSGLLGLEMDYAIEQHRVEGVLMLVFTPQSVATLGERLSYLSG